MGSQNGWSGQDGFMDLGAGKVENVDSRNMVREPKDAQHSLVACFLLACSRSWLLSAGCWLWIVGCWLLLIGCC